MFKKKSSKVFTYWGGRVWGGKLGGNETTVFIRGVGRGRIHTPREKKTQKRKKKKKQEKEKKRTTQLFFWGKGRKTGFGRCPSPQDVRIKGIRASVGAANAGGQRTKEHHYLPWGEGTRKKKDDHPFGGPRRKDAFRGLALLGRGVHTEKLGAKKRKKKSSEEGEVPGCLKRERGKGAQTSYTGIIKGLTGRVRRGGRKPHLCQGKMAKTT